MFTKSEIPNKFKKFWATAINIMYQNSLREVSLVSLQKFRIKPSHPKSKNVWEEFSFDSLQKLSILQAHLKSLISESFQKIRNRGPLLKSEIPNKGHDAIAFFGN